MKDPYTILGVTPDASDEEIKAVYRDLARKYHPDNYPDESPLKDLAKERMQEINAAYAEIEKERARGKGSSSSGGSGNQGYSDPTGIYAEIRRKISARRFGDAERDLFTIFENERTAEWHYLNSVLLMRRGNVNDAMRELEMACSMEPGNIEYQKAKQMFNGQANGYGSAYYNRGYGRRSSTDEACDCCANLICMDCLCECMGGDLIPCL